MGTIIDATSVFTDVMQQRARLLTDLLTLGISGELVRADIPQILVEFVEHSIISPDNANAIFQHFEFDLEIQVEE